jgi:carbamoyltransferase
MRVLGISAFYHDSAVALVIDGDVAAAAREERSRA